MWKHTLVALTTLTALVTAAHARPATSNEVVAAVGGIITGVILADAFDNADVSVHFASRHGERHYNDPRYGYDSDYRSRDSRHDRSPDRGGYYVLENRRVWVPGFWDYTRDRCGRKIKVWVEGRYETRRVKVWVSHNRHYNDRKGDPYCR